MTYEQWITASTTWTCPKSGIWEIICVGGGASGGKYNDSTHTQNVGGTTSFGNLLSASGGQKTSNTAGNAGGMGGYTGINYGGAGASVNSGNQSSPTGNGGNFKNPGLGYGAGGGTTESINGIPGECGELKSMTLDLTLNQQIACTIGAGGAATTSGTAGKAGCIHVRFIQ